MLGIKVTGVEEVAANMAKAVVRCRDAFEAAIFVVAGDVMRRDVMPRTPRESGELQGSAYVTRTAPVVEAGFSAEYAEVVHEVGKHKKYLQAPFSAASGTVVGRVAAVMPRLVESGTTLAAARKEFVTSPPPPRNRTRRRPTRVK